MRKWHRDLRKLAKRYGAELVLGKHLRLERRGCPAVTCSSSPRNAEMALRSIEADLQRYLPIPGGNGDQSRDRIQKAQRNQKACADCISGGVS